MCYSMMDCCVMYWKEGCWVKNKMHRRRIQLIDDLLEKKNYTDLKKTAEDRSVWRTIRRDCHKPASRADNLMMMTTKSIGMFTVFCCNKI